MTPYISSEDPEGSDGEILVTAAVVARFDGAQAETISIRAANEQRTWFFMQFPFHHIRNGAEVNLRPIY
jgi:hypothetical protein